MTLDRKKQRCKRIISIFPKAYHDTTSVIENSQNSRTFHKMHVCKCQAQVYYTFLFKYRSKSATYLFKNKYSACFFEDLYLIFIFRNFKRKFTIHFFFKYRSKSVICLYVQCMFLRICTLLLSISE